MPNHRPESRRWPPLGFISLYDDDPDETPPFLVWEDREPDLFDLLMLDWDPDERVVFLGLRTDSKQWKVWTDWTLRRIEGLILSDLAFDGCEVELTRIAGEGRPCNEEAKWELVINQSPEDKEA